MRFGRDHRRASGSGAIDVTVRVEGARPRHDLPDAPRTSLRETDARPVLGRRRRAAGTVDVPVRAVVNADDDVARAIDAQRELVDAEIDELGGTVDERPGGGDSPELPMSVMPDRFQSR